MKRIGFTLLLISIACAMQAAEKPTNKAKNAPLTETKYELVWSDEFDYKGLPDSKKWNFDTRGNASGWGNNEAQFYTSENLKNAEVKDGFLFINAIKEDFEGKKYTSARLTTRTKGDWLYGKIEVRAKLPEGRGMWPAIWMLSTPAKYGGWPAIGEIDIMENVGFDPYVIVASAHTKAYNHKIGTQKNAKTTIADCYSNFHNYILEWDAVLLQQAICRFTV